MRCLDAHAWAFFALIAAALVHAAHGASQRPILSPVAHIPASAPKTPLELDPIWTALGPLPAGMREAPWGAQPALAFANEAALLMKRISVPSTYAWTQDGLITADKKEVTTTILNASAVPPFSEEGATFAPLVDHTLSLVYPEAPWRAVRAAVGWAALQWQASAATNLSVTRSGSYMFLLDRATYFALLTEEEWDWAVAHPDEPMRVAWYTADVYSVGNVRGGIELLDRSIRKGNKTGQATSDAAYASAHAISLLPGSYRLLVRAIYEDRLFGDPDPPFGGQGNPPEIRVRIQIAQVCASPSASPGVDMIRVIATRPASLVPSLVDGWLAGWGVSVPVLNAGAETVVVCAVEPIAPHEQGGGTLTLQMAFGPVSIASLHMRPVPIKILQHAPLSSDEPLRMRLLVCPSSLCDGGLPPRLESEEMGCTWLTFALENDVRPGVANCSSDEPCGFAFTHLVRSKSIAIASATPPRRRAPPEQGGEQAVVLALHGAGVRTESPAWASALGRQDAWTIFPSGLTPWGLDWTLASAEAARDAVSEHAKYLYGLPRPQAHAHTPNTRPHGGWAHHPTRAIVVGHSNGGQGAVHLLTKYPDDYTAAVAASGYVSLAEYVPRTWSTSRHHPFVSGRRQGILEASLAALANDKELSNLAGLPVLLKVGEQDDNVPPHHSNEVFGVLRSWNAQTRCPWNRTSQHRVPARGHYWDEILQESDVQDFIRSELARHYPQAPSETGDTGCWRRDPVFIDGEKVWTHDAVLTAHRLQGRSSKNGWTILRASVPGEVAQLKVHTRLVRHSDLIEGNNQSKKVVTDTWLDSTQIPFAAASGPPATAAGSHHCSLHHTVRSSNVAISGYTGTTTLPDVCASVQVFINGEQLSSGEHDNSIQFVSPGTLSVRGALEGQEPNRPVSHWVPSSSEEDGIPVSWTRPGGPMLAFLQSAGPIQVVIPTRTQDKDRREAFSAIARRWAADVRVLMATDIEVVSDTHPRFAPLVDPWREEQKFPSWTDDTPRLMRQDHEVGNVVILGGPEENWVAAALLQESMFNLTDHAWQIGPHHIDSDQSLALLTLQPHPLTVATCLAHPKAGACDRIGLKYSRSKGQLSRSQCHASSLPEPKGNVLGATALSLVLVATDLTSLDRGAQLLPRRTGATVPEWVLIGPKTDWAGNAGTVGAGWFNNTWSWGEGTNWFSY